MGAFIGVVFQLLGGSAAASFYLPFMRVRGWSWESFWIVGGIASWVLAPAVAAWLTVPHFIIIIASAPVAAVFWTYVMGVLWGVGGLTYGLTMRYLGLSLGTSIILGLTASLGAIVPPIYRDLAGLEGERFTAMLANGGGRLVLLGALICLLGTVVCGRAGRLKELSLPSKASRTAAKRSEFNFGRGLVVAIISGVLSSCFAFGIETGAPIAQLAVLHGAAPIFQDNVVFVVILLGGFTTNIVACVWMNIRRRSFGDYVNRKSPLFANYSWSTLGGITWFLQFFFYGIGAVEFQNDTASWILHMSFYIALGNVWGVLLKEWRGVRPKAINTLWVGLAVLFASVVLVGVGNGIGGFGNA